MKIIDLMLIELFEGISKDELIKNLQQKRESRYLDMILKKMHELVQSQGDRHYISSSAFDISRMLGGAISSRELEKLYRQRYMNESQVNEWGRVVKGVNTTADVDTDEIKTQAAKFGNTVDKDGKPPTMNKKVKGSSTNVLYNLGLAENYTPMEIACIEGGHSLADLKPLKEKTKRPGKIFEGLISLTEDIAPHGSPEQEAQLMIAGKKPAALTYEQDFFKYFQTPAEMYDWVVLKFDPPNSVYTKYIVAQPGENNRAKQIVALIKAANKINFKFQNKNQEIEYHKTLGNLLGYKDSDIEDFIKSTVIKEETDVLEKIMLSEAMKDYVRFGTLRFQEPDPQNKVDGIILGSKHYKDRETEKLVISEQQEVGRMLAKFVKDPVSNRVTSVDADEGISFCLFNDNNLGVALLKKEFKFDKKNDYFTGYLITTVSQSLFPYSDQQLFRVPNDPNEPCRLFNKDDLKTLSRSQSKALTKTGRLKK